MKYILTIIATLFCFTLSSCESNELARIEFGTVGIEYEIKNRYNTTLKSDSLGFQPSGRYLYSWSNADESFYEGVYLFFHS